METSLILNLIKAEEKRQLETMELIPSENYASKDVRTALGSVLTNKYSEGYPGNRYYGGQEIIDEIEKCAQDTATQIFKYQFANVQPYSGTPANLAVYNALLIPGDTILSMSLDAGGHLSHGYKITLSGKMYNVINYGVNLEPGESFGRISYEEVEKLALEHKPKLIVAGGSAYPYIIDFAKFRRIADKTGAILMADIAHIAGLIAGDAHPSPYPHAHVITSTTHKTLRGPRGGFIMTDDEEMMKKINKAVFPGIQGGPHDNNTAAKAICFAEALTADFKTYANQTVKNAKALAKTLSNAKFKVETENHLMLLNVTQFGQTGLLSQQILESIGIIVNKQVLPDDSRKPADPSGIRLGSPAMTTRGFKENEFEQVGKIILEVFSNQSDTKKLSQIVKDLCVKFPLP